VIGLAIHRRSIDPKAKYAYFILLQLIPARARVNPERYDES